jgi:hypothetical protein
MNGSVARKLRKATFGDLSLRQNSYGIVERARRIFVTTKEGKKEMRTLQSGQLICTGARKQYKELKRRYSKGKIHA